jgi:hypothetical protein
MLFFPLVIYELLLLLDKFEYSEGALLQNAVALAGDVRFVPEIKRAGIDGSGLYGLFVRFGRVVCRLPNKGSPRVNRTESTD